MSTKLRHPLIGPNKPTWNFYNIKDNPEYWLAESIAAEFADIVGIDCTYYTMDPAVSADQLYGESMTKKFLEGKSTKLIMEIGEIPTLYSTFGLVATDQIVAHIPQATWYRDVSKTDVPKPGDAIIMPWYTNDYSGEISGRSFEVTHAAHDQSIFQLKSLVHVVYLIPYRYSLESQSATDVSSDISSMDISMYGDNAYISAAKYDSPDVDESIYGG